MTLSDDESLKSLEHDIPPITSGVPLPCRKRLQHCDMFGRNSVINTRGSLIDNPRSESSRTRHVIGRHSSVALASGEGLECFKHLTPAILGDAPCPSGY
jgi:hypothetical protein